MYTMCQTPTFCAHGRKMSGSTMCANAPITTLLTPTLVHIWCEESTAWDSLEKQLWWPMLILYHKFSMGCKLTWTTLILVMKISVSSRKLLWPTIMGLFSLVVV